MAKKIIITDSGFGGMNVLAETYEALKAKPIYFPLTLSFVEALPRNRKDCPWQGYSLMPDNETKIRVFNNTLSGIDKAFSPDIISVACNTLSVLLKETEFYSKHPEKLLNIVDIGLQPLKELDINADSHLIILGTETTLSSNLHKDWLLKHSNFKAENIIPAAFNPKSNYPLLIETSPFGEDTYRLSSETLKEATQKINAKDPTLYVYLGCTHFAFIKDTYKKILNDLGFGNVKIINPNTAMTNKILDYIDSHNLKSDTTYPINVNIYSQFKLTEEQIINGFELLNKISPFVANKLKNYILKNDIA